MTDSNQWPPKRMAPPPPPPVPPKPSVPPPPGGGFPSAAPPPYPVYPPMSAPAPWPMPPGGPMGAPPPINTGNGGTYAPLSAPVAKTPPASPQQARQPSTTQAVQQAANAGSQAESGKCPNCQKSGLAILPVVYAVAPKEHFDKYVEPALDGRALPEPAGRFGKNVTDKKLDTSRYYLRTLPPGYLYVLKSDKTWDAYVIDNTGLLHMMPPAELPSSPDKQPAMKKSCVREQHNIPAQVFALDPKTCTTAWIAYSRFRWTKKVLIDFASNEGNCRDKRMLKISVSQLATGIINTDHCRAASTESIEKWIADYRVEKAVTLLNDAVITNLQQRHGQAESLANKMAEISASISDQATGCIVALSDTVGTLSQLNAQRLSAQADKLHWKNEPERAWKKLSADAIESLRDRIFSREKATAIKEDTGEPWDKENNDPKFIKYGARPIASRNDFDWLQKRDKLPKGARFEPYTPGGPNGRILVPIDPEVQRRLDNDTPISDGSLARIEAHYDEPARAAFISDYDAELTKRDRLIAGYDKDFAVWLEAESASAFPNLTDISILDFRDTDYDKARDFICMVSDTIGEGPLSTHSQGWFERTLALDPTDSGQLLLRGLVGNVKPLLPWLHEDKKDAVYDGIANVLGAEDIKLHPLFKSALAAYASPILGAVNATTMAMDKATQAYAAARTRTLHIIAAGIKVWAQKEIGLLKFAKVKTGEFQQALLDAAFEHEVVVSKATSSGTQVGSARSTPFLRLSRDIAETSFDAMFWTVDTIDDLLDAQLAKSAQQMVSLEGLATPPKPGVQGVKVAIPSGSTRDLMTQLIKRSHAVASSPNAVLSVGTIYLQWFQITDNLEKVIQTNGTKQVDAALGLSGALLSVMSAGAALVEPWEKGRAWANGKSVSKIKIATYTRIAGVLGSAASALGAVQSAIAATGNFSEKDLDAGVLHSAAALSFTGAAYVGMSTAVSGASMTFLGSMAGLGPAGWIVLLTVAGIGLTYWALTAEDTDAEIFVARNAHWSISGRKEPRFRDWGEEVSAFNTLWYSVKAELEWNSEWFGNDEVTMTVTIAEPTMNQGWRYRLWLKLANGKEIEMYREAEGVPELPSAYKTRPRVWEKFDPNAGSLVDGRDFEYRKPTSSSKYVHPTSSTKQKDNPSADNTNNEKSAPVYRSSTTIQHSVGVNEDKFVAARLEFEYFPDTADLSTCAEFEIEQSP